jgi:hypothetical protein
MPKLIDIIVCDDIRFETGNKFSYMGIYQKDIFIPFIPWKTPRLCFVQSFYAEVGEFEFIHTLTGPTRELARINYKKKGRVYNAATPFIIRSSFEFLEIVEYGEYKLESYINNSLVPELTYKFKIRPNN